MCTNHYSTHSLYTINTPSMLDGEFNKVLSESFDFSVDQSTCKDRQDLMCKEQFEQYVYTYMFTYDTTHLQCWSILGWHWISKTKTGSGHRSPTLIILDPENERKIRPLHKNSIILTHTSLQHKKSGKN